MSDIVEVIARVIDCYGDEAPEVARNILGALREAGYHIETEFETEVGIALQGEEGVVFGPRG